MFSGSNLLQLVKKKKIREMDKEMPCEVYSFLKPVTWTFTFKPYVEWKVTICTNCSKQIKERDKEMQCEVYIHFWPFDMMEKRGGRKWETGMEMWEWSGVFSFYLFGKVEKPKKRKGETEGVMFSLIWAHTLPYASMWVRKCGKKSH